MRYLFLLVTIAILSACNNDTKVSGESGSLKAPMAKKEAKEFKEHGNTRVDDYFWMNNPNDSNVINHLKDENAYVAAFMKHTDVLQKKIYDEIVGRIDQKSETVPKKANGYWYYTRFEEGKQYQ